MAANVVIVFFKFAIYIFADIEKIFPFFVHPKQKFNDKFTPSA